MGTMKQAIFFTAVLIGAVMALSACGAQIGQDQGSVVATPATATATPHPDLPDRVRISTNDPLFPPPGPTFATPGAALPEVTLTDVAKVRQLYATIYALPKAPADQVCPAIAGPQYALTFLQGTATVVTAKADKGGCPTVTIAGESRARQASSAFWQQLDHAIIIATPVLKPDRFAIATASQPGQAPKSAMVKSATTAQQLYDAILALPRTDAGQGCSGPPQPTYQLVFFSGDQALPASVDNKCQTVEVDGGFQWRGGRFATNDQFRTMFQSIIADAPFAPAKPDHLSVAENTPQTVTPYRNVDNDELMQALYTQVFQLPQTAAQPNCPPLNDKMSGKTTVTSLTFTQWDLPLVRIDTYQGSCSYVQISETGPRLQGDQAFWDLIDRVKQMP